MSAGEASNVVQFRRPSNFGQGRIRQKQLMEQVYASGSIPVAPDDLDTKRLAALLQVLGFFTIHGVMADGTLTKLKPSDTIHADDNRPWRLSKPVRKDAGLLKA